MRDHWDLPVEEEIRQSGPEWLLLLLDRYDHLVCTNFLMLIWRCWMVRNGVLKAGDNISIEGSVMFLSRYMQSLKSIRQPDLGDDERGKQAITEPVSRASGGPRKKKAWTPPPLDMKQDKPLWG